MDARHDRGAARRRRLEIPVRGHVQPRPRRDGSGPRRGRQLVRRVTARAAAAQPPASQSPPSRTRTAAIPAVMLQELIDHARLDTPTRRAGSSSGRGRPRTAAPPCVSCRRTTRPPRRTARDRAPDPAAAHHGVRRARRGLLAIVHPHADPARPSPTDIGLTFYPDALYSWSRSLKTRWVAAVRATRPRPHPRSADPRCARPRGRDRGHGVTTSTGTGASRVHLLELVPLGLGVLALVVGRHSAGTRAFWTSSCRRRSRSGSCSPARRCRAFLLLGAAVRTPRAATPSPATLRR